MKAKKRIAKALEKARYGGEDGAHHKQWVIDQMLRELTGCPVNLKQGIDYNGKPYTFKSLGESDEYLQWVAEYEEGEDGPHTYEWDTGIAP